MNKDVLRGNWKELKGKLKARWGKLTDDQITQSEGNEEQLMGELEKAYGYSKEEARREFEDFKRALQ